MNTFNIKTPSQAKLRKVAAGWLPKDNIICELAPFTFTITEKKKDQKDQNDENKSEKKEKKEKEKKVTVIKSAPWCYIKDLPTFIINYLDQLDE